MDSHQRAKAWRHLLDLAKDPEFASIARQVFGGAPHPAPQSARQPEGDKKGHKLHFTGLSCALAGWWYTLLAPEPNFLFGTLLLVLAVLCLLLAIWDQAWTLKRKILSCAAAILLLIAMDCGWYWQRERVRIGILTEAQSSEREKARQLLTAHIDYEADDLINSVFAYENGSQSGITVSRLSFVPNGAFLVNDYTILDSIEFRSSEDKAIGPGGDGQSDSFLTNFLNPTTKVNCADVTFSIQYRLDAQPDLLQEKYFRFVTKAGRRGTRWLKEDVHSKEFFCRDAILQARAEAKRQH